MTSRGKKMVSIIKRIILISMLLSVSNQLHAQDTYEEFLRKQQQGIQEQEQAFAQYKAEVTAEYQKFYEQKQREFEEYKNQIANQWGKNNTPTSTKKDWVSYGNDFLSRRSVDFEKGEAKVEILIEESQTKDRNVIEQRLQNEVSKVVTGKGNEDPLEAKENAPPTAKPILSGQVETKDGKPVTEANVGQFAQQLVSLTKWQQENIVGKDGKKRVAFVLKFPLVPNHIKIRAKDFKDQVQKFAQKFNIDPSLVFAVIHTESWFNPKARSSAPAFGLMQLVPYSGARAAYIHIYGEDHLVTPEYLYQPENNMMLGTGYLDVLMSMNFKGIKDGMSKVYCAIAAYNTGPGNVAKAFVGRRDVGDAVAAINKMNSKEVFNRLRAHLPFQETRDYIAKVTERIPMYNEWSQK
jgi:membrane-bound lytic murein transglycosylase C